jgi:hypothetical protein
MPLHRTDINDSIYLAALQVCVIAVAYAFGVMCRFVVAAIRKRRYVVLQEEATQAPPPEILFDSHRELSHYVFVLHVTGMLLMVSMVALDYAHPWANYVFVLGFASQVMIAGLLAPCTYWARLRSLLYYVILIFLITFTGFKIPLPERAAAAPVSFTAFVVGITISGNIWAFSAELCANERDQSVYALPNIARHSCASCVLIALPLLFIIHHSRELQGQAGIQESGYIAWIIVVEPALKTLSIASMVVSIHNHKTESLLGVMVCVAALRAAWMYDTPVQQIAVVFVMVCSVVILLIIGATDSKHHLPDDEACHLTSHSNESMGVDVVERGESEI